MAPIRILLVEDDLWWGELLKESLERRNYAVELYVRARVETDGSITLTDIDGRESPLDSSRHDIALIDGRMKTSPLNGPELVPHVVKLGLTAVGISGSAYFNQEMVEAGAKQAILKHDLFTQLVDGKTTIAADGLKTAAPAKA